MTTKKIKPIVNKGDKINTCYHCGLPIGVEQHVSLVNKKQRDMCCAGCKAVADAIVASGMESYYSFRETNSATAKELVPDFLKALQAYDNPIIQQQFVYSSKEKSHFKEVSLILEGITCSACVWLNEQYLSQLKGVVRVKINYSTYRATVEWDSNIISLSDILEAISRIGYLAHPYDVAKQQKVFEEQKGYLLKQLGVAALFGMQTMMFAVALYSGEYWGISDNYKLLFQWLSLFLTLPVLFFSAQPFFKGALTDLTHARAGMDVPVTLGMSIAFISSVYNTFNQTGAVYFDSVCMFVFLLLGVRYIELAARKKSAENIENLADRTPAMANVRDGDGFKAIPIAELKINDEALVRAGDYVPADAVLLSQTAELDESLLTGESKPVSKQKNDTVIAGSLNVGQAMLVTIKSIGQETVLAGILRLVEEAQLYKPEVAILADKVASKFVVALIILVSIAGVYWYIIDASQMVAIIVATLVVTCPCALSLATPAAVSATIGQSTTLGVLVANTNALEQLEKADVFLFDKTGTLTQGKLSIESIRHDDASDQQLCLSIAKSLEQYSEHPIANAFAQIKAAKIELTGFSQTTGKGLSASYKGKTYYLGSLAWMEEILGEDLSKDYAQDAKAVYLFSQQHYLSAFYLNDPIKADAKQTIEQLKKRGKTVVLLSGDQKQTVIATAKQLGIEQTLYQQMPEQKLAYLKSLQQQGKKVVMVGDGINDAPVLAAADVALSMSSGTDIASASADLIVKGTRTQAIVDVVDLSRKMNIIIKQNFAWAIGYNLIAIPFAFSGMIAPWLAAVGMSLSSLVVVLNAKRLRY